MRCEINIFCEKWQRSGSSPGSLAIRRNSNSKKKLRKKHWARWPVLAHSLQTRLAAGITPRRQQSSGVWQTNEKRTHEHRHGSTADPMETMDTHPTGDGGVGRSLAGFPLDLLGNAVPVSCGSGTTTPDYGHGFFVPIFAGFLLWQRQEMVDPWPNRGTWWGIPFFAVFALIRWFNLFLNYERDIDSLIAIPGWRDARSGRMACPAVGVAFDRLFDFHGAAPGLPGRGVGARNCNAWPPS